MKKLLIISRMSLVLLCLSTIPAISHATPVPPSDNDGPDGDKDADDCPAPAGAPVDGGLSLLLIAGVGYGVKKIAKNKRNQKNVMYK